MCLIASSISCFTSDGQSEFVKQMDTIIVFHLITKLGIWIITIIVFPFEFYKVQLPVISSRSARLLEEIGIGPPDNGNPMM